MNPPFWGILYTIFYIFASKKAPNVKPFLKCYQEIFLKCYHISYNTSQFERGVLF